MTMKWNFDLSAAPEYFDLQVALPSGEVFVGSCFDTEEDREWYTSGGDSISIDPIAWAPLLEHPWSKT